MFERVQL